MTTSERTDRCRPSITRDEAVEDFRLACISRALDDREITLQKQTRVFFQISGAGHEALLLGLARELRAGLRLVLPVLPRPGAACSASASAPRRSCSRRWGAPTIPRRAAGRCPRTGATRPQNVVTQSSPTGSQCLPAVGCAEAARYISRRPDLPGCTAHGDELTYVSIGEGATSEGDFWESLNTACTLHLPVLYVIADNGYAISVPSIDQAPAPISELVRGFRGLDVHVVDGCDYFAVRELAAHAVPRVRAGVGPALIHARVTRPYSHSAADTQSKYRSSEELADEAARDPLLTMARELVGAGFLTAEEADTCWSDAVATVADAARRRARRGRGPIRVSVADHVTDLPDVRRGRARSLPATSRTRSSVDARREHQPDAARGDGRATSGYGSSARTSPTPREALLADVEGKGGVFGTTHGLQRAFGLARCYNSPLAESNIIGRAIGQAVRGLRPAPEIQFFDYIWPAMQQLKSEAATIRWRSNGAFTVPMVVRVPIGGYLQGGAIWHSQSGESIFAHVPGLLIAFPSRARDAVGLLRTAFRCEDPVLFLEHKHLLRQPYARDPFPPPDYLVPFGRGAIRRPGRDLTIVTWGATVQKSLEAAARVHDELDREVEVLDLRSLVPWDRDLVADSVRRTGRLLVVHEDVLTCGFGAEVAAWAADELFADLRGADPPGRRPRHPRRLRADARAAILPQVEDIAAAAATLLGGR